MKKCPFCAEEIQNEAKICRFCNMDLISDKPFSVINPFNNDVKPRKIEARSGVQDGVRIGFGMFIVLSLIIVIIGGAIFLIITPILSAIHQAELEKEQKIELKLSQEKIGFKQKAEQEREIKEKSLKEESKNIKIEDILSKIINKSEIEIIKLLGEPISKTKLGNLNFKVNNKILTVFMTNKVVAGWIWSSENSTVKPESANEELAKSPFYLNYYNKIREKIRLSVYKEYNGREIGEVALVFIVGSNGDIKDIRVLEGLSTDSSYLRQIAINAIKTAAPFPIFPKGLNYPQLSFNMIFSYETEENNGDAHTDAYNELISKINRYKKEQGLRSDEPLLNAPARAKYGVGVEELNDEQFKELMSEIMGVEFR